MPARPICQARPPMPFGVSAGVDIRRRPLNDRCKAMECDTLGIVGGGQVTWMLQMCCGRIAGVLGCRGRIASMLHVKQFKYYERLDWIHRVMVIPVQTYSCAQTDVQNDPLPL